MPSYTPSHGELLKIEEHLEYEIQMLFNTTKTLQDIFQRGYLTVPRERCVHNALLESFLIHARGLIDFLYPKSTDQDDVFALHFLSDPSMWTKNRSNLPTFFEEVRNRTNKEIAHLTYYRTQVIIPSDKDWDFVKIASQIASDLKDFESLALPSIQLESLVRVIRKFYTSFCATPATSDPGSAVIRPVTHTSYQE